MGMFRCGFRPLIWVALALLPVGCAPAYHAYRPGCYGCIEYGYCPPSPLPYTSYGGCPTPVASGYADRVAPTSPRGRESPVPMEANEATHSDSGR
jgi:hypothetical protein